MKKPALLWALQFQFNCGIYPIIHLSSLKLPMDSQCIQTSSKSISVSSVRGDFDVYIARYSANLTKISKWYIVWQYEYGCLPLHNEISNLLHCSTITAWIQVGLFKTKSKMIYLTKQVCPVVIHRNTSHILDTSCCHKHQ